MASLLERRYFGKYKEIREVPNLVELQLQAYEEFLQKNVPSYCREDKGLESIMREMFPIQSFNQKYLLKYLGYELGEPRYSPEECRELKLTYGAPFKIRLQLIEKSETNEKPVEEEVYLGEFPIPLGGGEFIINGIERVIVSQLHRSPGIDFGRVNDGEKQLHACWIVPERGSWIDIGVNKKDSLVIQIDKSTKFPITTFLRALEKEYSSDEALFSLFYTTKEISLEGSDPSKKIRNAYLAETISLKFADEKVKKGAKKQEAKVHELPAGTEITEKIANNIVAAGFKAIKILGNLDKTDSNVIDKLLVNTVKEDTVSDIKRDTKKENDPHKAALNKIFARLRPGNPFNVEKAKNLITERFKNPLRYRLGKVGRFRLNRKFNENKSVEQMELTFEDIINAIRYIMGLRRGHGEIDDIDHLGNRRLRTITELAGDELRKAFHKLRRTIQDKINVETEGTIKPKSLINAKIISSAIEYYFGTGELSQIVDQTNPLTQLTHERRLSALGPGGLNRKRAGFEVRDAHISHYGRICPIETPEGPNIGLITSLSIYAKIDSYGFLITPYRVVKNRKVLNQIKYLRADEEFNRVLAPADNPIDENGYFINDKVMARVNCDYKYIDAEKIEFCDISPKQLVGVSASLIPFLEHDDANRALMGSNMQRQAVPLLMTEPPLVGTGMEKCVARNSNMLAFSDLDGKVIYVDSEQVVIEPKDKLMAPVTYNLRKFSKLNNATSLNQKPIIKEKDKIKKGQIIADGAATHKGELALGRNLLVAFMPWEGYNFEDAIVVSEKLVKEDYFTSIHIEVYEAEIRETKSGKEEFTRDIPNVSASSLKNLNEDGIVKVGTYVKSRDILVGKVVPKPKTELSPEEKLMHAVFGKYGEDVKNKSLKVPPGVEGVVIKTKKFARKIKSNAEESSEKIQKKYFESEKKILLDLYDDVVKKLKAEPIDVTTDEPIKIDDDQLNYKTIKNFWGKLNIYNLKIEDEELKKEVAWVIKKYTDIFNDIETKKNKEIVFSQTGDELPTGVLELVKVYVATKRKLSVGDKMAGRHGNKGVIAKILPEEDMPFLEDGTPIELVLSPLGVPSRMNVGQILETHLGWAANASGFQAITPVFDGCTEKEIEECLKDANLPSSGTIKLYDGRTGDAFDQDITVGYIYMMKLNHLVDDKVHARSTGPYSLITQQPLGGKARSGGQRLGEMEVWALEAYGATNILQELLTVKSDDIDGRTKIYEAMIKGKNILNPGTPASFDVLVNEIKGLALNMQLSKNEE